MNVIYYAEYLGHFQRWKDFKFLELRMIIRKINKKTGGGGIPAYTIIFEASIVGV